MSCGLPSPLVLEAVPHSTDGLDSELRQAGRAELAAQARDMHVHGARLDEAVATPDEVEQLLPAEDPSRHADQRREQRELLRGEVDGLALHPDLEAVAVDLEVARLEPALALRGLELAAPADHRADAGHELAGRERLRHVVVGAHLEAQHLVAFLGAARDHDHGDGAGVRLRLDAAADLPAVELRDHDVEEDQVGEVLPGHLQGLGAAGDDAHLVTFAAQVIPDELGHVRLVLDDERAARGARASCDPRGFRGTPSAHALAHLPAGSDHGVSLGWRGYSLMTPG